MTTRQIDWNDWEPMGLFWIEGARGDQDTWWTWELTINLGWYADLGDAEREPDVYAVANDRDETLETFATYADALAYANSHEKYQEPDGEDL